MAIKPLSSNKFPSRIHAVICLAFVLAVTFISLSPGLQNRFITNDDPGHLLNNVAVRSLSLESISRMFQQTPNKTYVPLTTLSFAVEYHFFGFVPFFYHLNNLLLHLVNVALIFLIAVRWLEIPVLAAALASLLFGIHPMHVESVAWITERKDVLYAVFYLLAVERYCAYRQSHRHQRVNYFLSLTFALLSILSKPMALSLPLILFVLDWYSHRKLDLKVFAEKIPFFLVIVPVAWVTYILNARMVGTTLPETVLTWIWSLMFYPQKFFFPDILLPIYALPKPVDLFNLEFLKAVFLFVVLVISLVIYRKKRLFLFAAVYYFVSIFFLLRFDDKVDVNFVADRFMYLPSLGICLAVGLWAEWLMGKFNRKFVILAIVVICFFLGGRTFAQTKKWGDGVLLWSGVIDKYPDCFYAYDHRGYAYGQKGQFREAISDYTDALRLKPRYLAAYHNRALAYGQLGEDNNAIADFEKTFELDPNYVIGYFNRGIFWAQRGEYDKALADYNKAIEETNGLYSQAYGNRGTVYLSQKMIDEAIKDFSKAIELDGRDNFARNNRAIGLALKGDNESALRDLNEAIKIAPKDVGSYFNRGLVYLRLQNPESALVDFKKVLEIDPQHKAALQKAFEIQNNRAN